MKTFTFTFSNQEALKKFVLNNKIIESDSVLIQIFSWIIDKNILRQLVGIVHTLLPKAVIIWSTTSWEIIWWKIQNKTVVISFTLFEKTKLRDIFITKNSVDSIDLWREVWRKLISSDTKAVILFTAWNDTNAEDVLRWVSEINSSTLVSWWKASDNRAYKTTYIFNEKFITSEWVIGVALNSQELIVNNFYNFDWFELWKSFVITKSERNRIYELDNMPIYDVYKKYLWGSIAEKLPSTWVEFPLVIEKNGMKIARAIVDKMEDGSFQLWWNVQQWDIVRFWCGHKDTILRSSVNIFNQMSQVPAETIFVYSCSWRKKFLWNEIQQEFLAFPEIAPTIGFFTYWEFFHTSYHNEFLNDTMTILMLSESREIKQVPKKEIEFSMSDNSVYALSNFTKAMSDDLIHLNKWLEKKVEEKVYEIEKNSVIYMQAYKKIIDSMSECVWIGDKDKKTVYANPNFCKLAWYELDEIMDKHIFLFMQQWESKIDDNETELDDTTNSDPHEVKLRAKTGETIPVLLIKAPFINEGRVCIMTDLRELKQIKEEKKELEEANRMKDEFISIASHELRTPMTSIKWYLSMILDEDYWEISDDLKSAVDVMYSSSQRLIGMINDMLDISKLESWQMEFHRDDFSLNWLIHTTYEEMKWFAYEKKLTLIEEYDSGKEYTAHADEEKVREVIINLIWNAFKFTKEWWSVTIRLSNWQPWIAKIEVIDTGIWIKEEDFSKVFEKFVQVESHLTRKDQWTWLGLPLSKALIELMGWNLGLTSKLWEWSNFYFTIPLATWEEKWSDIEKIDTKELMNRWK